MVAARTLRTTPVMTTPVDDLPDEARALHILLEALADYGEAGSK